MTSATTPRSVVETVSDDEPLVAKSSMTFWGWQRRRLSMRWLLVRTGFYSALFWTAAVIVASWLRHYGYGFLLPWMLGAWALLALPVLYLDLALILDMVGYVVTGRISFYPTLERFWATKDPFERRQLRLALAMPLSSGRQLSEEQIEEMLSAIRGSRFVKAVLEIVNISSPFSTFALWAMVVLSRIPSTAHVLLTASTARRMKVRVEEGLYEAALDRLAG